MALRSFLFIVLYLSSFVVLSQSEDSIVPPPPEYTLPNGDSVILIDDATTWLAPSLKPVPLDSINRLKNEPEFGYMSYVDSFMRHYKTSEHKKSNKTSPTTLEPQAINIFGSMIVKLISWLVAIGFVAVLLYQFFAAKGFFKGRSKSVANGDNIVTNQEDENVDFDQQIEKCIQQSDYRNAVRYWYLKTLQHLSDKQLIVLTPHKTNHQYVQELSGSSQHSLFANLTLKYEYIWYGNFNIDKPTFESVQQGFITMNS